MLRNCRVNFLSYSHRLFEKSTFCLSVICHFLHSSKYDTAKLLLSPLSFVVFFFLFQFLLYIYGSPLIQSPITICNLLYKLTPTSLIFFSTHCYQIIAPKIFFFNSYLPGSKLTQHIQTAKSYRLVFNSLHNIPNYFSHTIFLYSQSTHLSSEIILHTLSLSCFIPSLKESFVALIPVSKNQLSRAQRKTGFCHYGITLAKLLNLFGVKQYNIPTFQVIVKIKHDKVMVPSLKRSTFKCWFPVSLFKTIPQSLPLLSDQVPLVKSGKDFVCFVLTSKKKRRKVIKIFCGLIDFLYILFT